MGFKSKNKISLDEFLIRAKSMNYSKRRACWIKLIEANRLICPASQKEVSYCSIDENQNRVKSIHLNFYSEDGDMFTIDHILPKSKGGKHVDLDNIQPMIAKHNHRKGNKTNLGY